MHMEVHTRHLAEHSVRKRVLTDKTNDQCHKHARDESDSYDKKCIHGQKVSNRRAKAAKEAPELKGSDTKLHNDHLHSTETAQDLLDRENIPPESGHRRQNSTEQHAKDKDNTKKSLSEKARVTKQQLPTKPANPRPKTTSGVLLYNQPEISDTGHALVRLCREQRCLSKLASVSQNPGRHPLDVEEDDDPIMASAYVGEIYEYMRALQLEDMPAPDYVSIQPHLDWEMREELVDWLIAVHTRFQFLGETLHLTVHLMDRFLSKKPVSRRKLQLVALSALFIASKYEETVIPSIAEYVNVTDNAYSSKELLEAERFMLSTLQYKLGWPGPLGFLRRSNKAEDYDEQTRTMAKFYLEASLLVGDGWVGVMSASQAAAGALWLARMRLSRGDWNADLAAMAGHSADEAEEAADKLRHYIKSGGRLATLCRKWNI